jgi:RimJ/RimL family protein N-acetyltransferase
VIHELYGAERLRVLPLIRNGCNELSVRAVIHGELPGSVLVDDRESPTRGLVRTTECNLLFGRPDGAEFNRDIRDAIGCLDQLTCDHPGWEDVVYGLHRNNALRKYTRAFYTLAREDFRGESVPSAGNLRIIRHGDLGRLPYANAEIVSEWIKVEGLDRLPGLPLAAVVIRDGAIVSCSALDCIHDGRVEIGVKTRAGHRRMGHGKAAVLAMADASFRSGVREIGWHCVATNAGSRRIAEECGFTMAGTYDSFTPYPPIENETDLSAAQWIEYALFLEGRAAQDGSQDWQAARCRAKAEDMEGALVCLSRLAATGATWFIGMMEECGEFNRFTGRGEWEAFTHALGREGGDGQ